MRTVAEEQQRTEKGSDFLQNVCVTEGLEGVGADLSGVLLGTRLVRSAPCYQRLPKASRGKTMRCFKFRVRVNVFFSNSPNFNSSVSPEVALWGTSAVL